MRRSSRSNWRTTASSNGRSAAGGKRSTPSRPRSGAGRGSVLVQLIHEHHYRVHAQVAPLEVLAQLRHDARKHEVLAERVHVREVYDVHGAVLELAPGEVVREAVIGDQALAAGGNVG